MKISFKVAVMAVLVSACASAPPPPEAAFPEAFAAAAKPASIKASPIVQGPDPVNVPNQSKDVIDVTIGKDIADTYRLTYQVDDGDAWEQTTKVPAALAALGVKKALRRTDGSMVLAVHYVEACEGCLQDAADKVKAKLPGTTVPMMNPDAMRVNFTFVATDKEHNEHPGSVALVDLKLYHRYVVIASVVDTSKSANAAVAAEMAVKLAVLTLRLR